MMKKLIFMPGRLASRAWQTILKIQVPGPWLHWWQRWQTKAWATADAGPAAPAG